MFEGAGIGADLRSTVSYCSLALCFFTAYKLTVNVEKVADPCCTFQQDTVSNDTKNYKNYKKNNYKTTLSV